MADSFEDAKEQVHAWKHGDIRKAAVELVQAGLRGLCAGADYFGPDNIPQDVVFDGGGTVGIATSMLLSANVIRQSLVHIPSKEIHYGRRHSLRKSAHNRKVQLYSLVNRGIAEAWLRLNDVEVPQKQYDLALA